MERPVLSFRRLRDLDVDTPTQPGRNAFVAAASGLVRAGPLLYVVPDDEVCLAVFRAAGRAPGKWMSLLADPLPAQPAERKRHKPDFEVLLLLPAFQGYPHGALWALGSGSTARRRRSVLCRLRGDFALHGPPRTLVLDALYEQLSAQVPELNLEAAAVVGDRLLLVSRGHRAQENTVFELSLPGVLAALAASMPPGPEVVVGRRDLALGEVAGVRLGVTDACALPSGGLVLSAVCEDTSGAYDDGPCVASAVVLTDPELRVAQRKVLDHPWKLEGIHASVAGKTLELLAVCDADDPCVPSPLLKASLSWSTP